MPSVTFLGVGDASDPERGATSLLYGGTASMLLDCGPSTVESFFALVPDPEALDAVFITHQHADHCFGLPSLLMVLRRRGRRRSLFLCGGPGSSQSLGELLEFGYPRGFLPSKCFPIEMVELIPGQPRMAGPLRLSTAPTNHSTPCFALRIDDAGWSAATSGDGRPSRESLDLFRGVELLVHECSGLVAAHPNHCDLETLEAQLDTSQLGRVALVHVEPGARGLLLARSGDALGGRAFVPERGERYRFPAGAAPGLARPVPDGGRS